MACLQDTYRLAHVANQVPVMMLEIVRLKACNAEKNELERVREIA